MKEIISDYINTALVCLLTLGLIGLLTLIVYVQHTFFINLITQ